MYFVAVAVAVAVVVVVVVVVVVLVLVLVVVVLVVVVLVVVVFVVVSTTAAVYKAVGNNSHFIIVIPNCFWATQQNRDDHTIFCAFADSVCRSIASADYLTSMYLFTCLPDSVAVVG